MSRVRPGPVTKARHKKVIKAAKGHYGARSRTFRSAAQSVDKALQYSTRDRRVRKRTFRALWIQRINAAIRLIDPTCNYSSFMYGLSKAEISVDRKILAELAVNEPEAFKKIYEMAQTKLA